MNENQTIRKSLLDFEKLVVYQKAMIFRRQITPLTSRPPRKGADLVDHLDRACDSILLNIAEGSGCIPRSKDRFRFNRTALKSAREALSALHILQAKGQIAPPLFRTARPLAMEIIRILKVMSEP